MAGSGVSDSHAPVAVVGQHRLVRLILMLVPRDRLTRTRRASVQAALPRRCRARFRGFPSGALVKAAQSACRVIQAIDAVTGDLVWEHRREVPDDVADYVFNTLWQNNRNIAVYGSTILDTSADDHIFALDAKTGRMVWETEVSTIGPIPPPRARAPSSPTARSSRAGAACPRAGPTPASSPPTTPTPAASCGAGAPSRRRASRATRPGAGCRSRSAGTSGRGWCRATTPP